MTQVRAGPGWEPGAEKQADSRCGFPLVGWVPGDVRERGAKDKYQEKRTHCVIPLL